MQEQTSQGRTRIWSGGFSSSDMEGLLGQHFGALFQEGLEPLMRQMDGELRRLLDPPQSVPPLDSEESEGFCLRPGASEQQMRQQVDVAAVLRRSLHRSKWICAITGFESLALGCE